jgi:hypothetical protein
MPSSRIRRLIAGHLALMATPLAMLAFELSTHNLPLFWFLASLPIGSLMTIAVWLGLGRQRLLTRLMFSLLAIVYAVGCQVAQQVIELARISQSYDWSGQMFEGAALYLVMVAVIGALFGVSKRWWVICRHSEAIAAQPKRGLRFSLLGLIMLTTLVSVVITLSRASRNTILSPDGEHVWFMIATFALFVVCLVANTYFAVHAVLRPGSIALSLVLVLLLAVSLGVAISLAMRQDTVGLWMVLGGSVISIAPTAVVVGSMLVARSCGVRLVRRTPEPLPLRREGAAR